MSFMEVKGHQRSSEVNYVLSLKLGQKNPWCNFDNNNLYEGQRSSDVTCVKLKQCFRLTKLVPLQREQSCLVFVFVCLLVCFSRRCYFEIEHKVWQFGVEDALNRRQMDIVTYQVRNIKAYTSLCLFVDEMLKTLVQV